MERNQFKENVILVDTAFVDSFAGMARQHFSKEMGEELPVGVFSDFLVCAAVTAGFPENLDADNPKELQVVLVTDRDNAELQNFYPARLDDIDGCAFMSKRHGEFLVSVVHDEELYEGAESLMMESARVLMNDDGVKRLAVVNHADAYTALTKLAEEVAAHDVDILVMPPQLAKTPAEGQQFMQMVMYSLGIRSAEMEEKFAFAFDYPVGQA